MTEKALNFQERDTWIVRARLEAAERHQRRGAGGPCCGVVANLRYSPLHNKRLNTVVLQCRVCKRTHYHMVADPGRLNVVNGG